MGYVGLEGDKSYRLTIATRGDIFMITIPDDRL